MSEDLNKHDEIIAEAREKYTVHHCGECEFRKSCCNKFDSDECKDTRQSIMLGFGLEDGYFTKLLNRLEAAHKREATCEKSSQVGNNAKMREAIAKCVNLITEFGNAEIVKTPLDVIIDIEAILKAALSAPPRNCDKCNSADQAVALAIDAGVVDCNFGAREMAEFLLAKAKGETDGNE